MFSIAMRIASALVIVAGVGAATALRRKEASTRSASASFALSAGKAVITSIVTGPVLTTQTRLRS
ncbi:MAG TPA: hypothetical protein VGR85_07265 [Candidatus Limnocylindria bacterium]|nr:hypothetical protein [Candidatus Limnocylindria bacterium]